MKRKSLLVSVVILVSSTFLIAALSTPKAAAADGPGGAADYVYLTPATSDMSTSITVSWKSASDYTGKVLYGTESGNGNPDSYANSVEGDGGTSSSNLKGCYHHVELTNLEPNTKYYFIVGSTGAGWCGEQTFTTTSTEPEDLKFVVGGDSRSTRGGGSRWPGAKDKVTELMAGYNPSFMIFNGDFLWSGEVPVGDDTWENWFDAWFRLARDENGNLIPIVPVIGNHEITYPQPNIYKPEQNASNYFTVFNLPGKERWYSLSWENLLYLSVLDGEILDTGSTSWNNQLRWFKSSLDSNSGDIWKFVAIHRPFYSTPGEHGGELKRMEDLTWPIDKHHVDIIFQSHNHGYERTGPINHTFNPGEKVSSPENGTIYVTSAGWGAPLYPNQKKYSWFTAEDSPGRLGAPENIFHAVLVEVTARGTLSYKAIKHAGAVFDQMTIQKKGLAPEEGGGGVPIIMIVAAAVVVIAVVVGAVYVKRSGGSSSKNTG